MGFQATVPSAQVESNGLLDLLQPHNQASTQICQELYMCIHNVLAAIRHVVDAHSMVEIMLFYLWIHLLILFQCLHSI